MCLKLIKYLLLFLLFSIPLYSESLLGEDAPSPKEEIRDTIVVHGMTLHGKIMKIGPEKLSFRLLYSEGMSHFAYRDIDKIETKYTYHISYNRMDIEGRVIGIEDNAYLKVIEKDENLRTVKIADIDNFVMSVTDDDSIENRLRNRIPYTKGNINIGFEIEESSTIKNSIDILLNLQHKQAEHELKLYVNYEFETREAENIPKYEYKDELVGILTYQNHFLNKQFWYTTLAADYDRPRYIKNRYIPSLGYGYRFEFGKSIWIEPAIGMAYALTRYTDDIYDEKDFAAAAFTATGKYRIDDVPVIDTFIIDGFVMYYPSIENFAENWILRSNLTFTIPLFDFLSVKLVMNQVNDSNPAVDVGNNKTTTKLLFGLDF